MSEEWGKACPIREVIKEELVKYLPPAIGRGSCGTVYKGTYVKAGKETDVAVKKIDKESNDEINKQFAREISFYEQLKHPNIIHYHGTVISKASYLIVMEFADKGNLFEYLKKLRIEEKKLNQKLKLKWQIEATRGIQYLHWKGITHGDIKSLNLLITFDDTLKLCDFGNTKSTLASIISKTQSTPQWQAPEMFETEPIYSSKVDIFALGVVVWELETCQEPYSGYSVFQILQKIVAGERLHIPYFVNKRARQLISNCCKQDRKERPNIHLVVRELVTYTAEVSKVSQRDIQFIITTLGPNHLKQLYIELEIPAATVPRREALAQGDDVDAKAREVLQGWVTNNGSKATRGAVLEALRRAELRDAEDKCRDKWNLPDLPPTTKSPNADTSKSTLQQPQKSTDTANRPPIEKQKHRSISRSEESSSKPSFKKRDRVRIKDLETKEMERLQDGHGGYNKLMGMSRNQTGKVVREYFTGDVHVRLESGISWTYNPECLTWISDGSGDSTEKGREINGIRKGSRVKIRNMEIDEMKRLQKLHGGYNPRMSLVRNGLGKVKKIDSGDIVVKTDDGPKFAFNPECVELVEDEAEHEWQDGLYKKGSGVRIIESIELEEMKKMQKECGRWLPEMDHLRGKQGVICKVTLSRVMVKMQNGRIYAIYPYLLIPDDEARTTIQRGIRKGDQVKVKSMYVDHMMELQEGNGGWIPELQNIMNKLGRVLSVRLGRAATLKMNNGRNVCFNTECLDLVEPAPGPERNPWSDDSSEDSSDDSDEEELIAGLAKQAAKQVFAQISRNRNRSESSNTNSSGDANGQRLLQAARRGDISIVRQILHSNPGLADVLSDDGNQTPLLLACRAGDLEMARIIVDAGASLDKGNVTQNVTPLILCAYENRLEVLRFLLEKGADINGVDDDGDTALYSAAAKGNDKCVDELMKPEYKCDVNKLNKKFISAAIVAIVKKQDNICESILRSPTFDPKLTDSQDMNCLHIAAAYGNARAIGIILEIWPDGINVPHKHGITALGIACTQNHTDCVKVLLAQEKCDRNVRFLGYTTCLHHASMRGNLDIAKLLVQFNVEFDAQDNDGDTPLHLCCLMKSRAAEFFAQSEISHLLTRELEEREMKLPTPETQEKITEFLVRSGASLDIRNNKGITPLDMLKGTSFYSTIRDIANEIKKELPARERERIRLDETMTTSVSAPVTYEGDQLNLKIVGANLQIPKGAIPRGETVRVTISLADDDDYPPLDDCHSLISPIVKCEPAGHNFLRPATLILPSCAVGEYQPTIWTKSKQTDGAWIKMQVDGNKPTSEKSVKITLSHFCDLTASSEGPFERFILAFQNPLELHRASAAYIHVYAVPEYFVDMVKADETKSRRCTKGTLMYLEANKEKLDITLNDLPEYWTPSEQSESIKYHNIIVINPSKTELHRFKCRRSFQFVKCGNNEEQISEIRGRILISQKGNTDEDVDDYFDIVFEEDASTAGHMSGRPEQTGAQVISDKDIFMITNRAGLTKNDLDTLFKALNIPDVDVDNGRRNADTTDFKLQSNKILIHEWKKKEGSAATRQVVLDALKNDAIAAAEYLEREWGITS